MSSRDAEMFRMLVNELAELDGHTVSEGYPPITNSLMLRLAYWCSVPRARVGQPRGDETISDADRYLQLYELSEVRGFLRWLEMVMSVFRHELAEGPGDVFPCIRDSQLYQLPRWQCFFGTDPIELVVAVEHAIDTVLEDCLWCEFPILEIAQGLNACHGDYSQTKHIRRIAEGMEWPLLKGDECAGVDARVLGEVIAVLWGIPFRFCGPSESVVALLNYRASVSRDCDVEMRLLGLHHILCGLLGRTKRREKRKIRSVMQRSMKPGASIESLAMAIEAYCRGEV